MIGLKFLLQGGQFFIAFLPPEEANKILGKWLRGEYDLNGPSRIGKVLPEGSWIIDVKSIVGIHTVTREELLGQMPSQQPMTSGVSTPLQAWRG